MTLTIGKSFLNDFKRVQISKAKLEKLLKFMTLTIGKRFLEDFLMAQFPLNKLEKLLRLCSALKSKEWFPPKLKLRK